MKNCRSVLTLLLMLFPGTCVAVAETPDPAAALLKDATDTITDLQQKKTFFNTYRAEALLAQRAAVEYGADPRLALWYAREIKEPFYASLAVGACAVQAVKADPAAARDLLLGAQERALSIEHSTGSDATSLDYLFQTIPTFPRDDAQKLLQTSRRNLGAWIGDSGSKRKPALELTRQTLAIDPDGIDALLQVLSSTDQATHLSESFRLLAGHLYTHRHAWALEQVNAFYASKKSFLAADPLLAALLLEDAVSDPPRALANIEKMDPSDQDMALVRVADALHGAGKIEQALEIVKRLEQRAAAQGAAGEQTSRLVNGFVEGWAREKVAAAGTIVPAMDAQAIDTFIETPSADAWRLQWVGKALTFRDAAQTQKFVDAALPLARQVHDMGYPHHGSPRSQSLGTLACAAALAGDLERAKAIADEIDIPELRALYLLAAYETVHPLPDVVRGWPIFFFPQPRVQIMVPRQK
jgi:hypothetical protein